MCDQINKRGIKHILNGEKIVICEQNNGKKNLDKNCFVYIQVEIIILSH